MTINLQKGQRIDLGKESGGDTNFYVGLSWDAGANHDLDASVFECQYNPAGDPVLLDPPSFVYYNNLTSADGAIIHSGDNLTGDGDGDDEQIRIFLDKVDPRVNEISVIVTIHDAVNRRQNFGQVKKPIVRICQMDASGNPTNEVARYELDEDASAFTALQFAQIYRKDASTPWKFNAVGQGYAASLNDIVTMYAPGVPVSYVRKL